MFVYFSEYLRASIQNENTFSNMSIDCYLLRLSAWVARRGGRNLPPPYRSKGSRTVYP